MRDLSHAWVFHFTRAVGERRAADAERMIERLLAEGEPPLRLSALLATHIGSLLEVRPLVDALPPGALQMSGNQFVAGPMQSLPESFRRRNAGWRGYFRLKEAAAFDKDELLRLHAEVVELDLALKGVRVSPLMLFSRLLQSACRPPEPRTGIALHCKPEAVCVASEGGVAVPGTAAAVEKRGRQLFRRPKKAPVLWGG
jgi:DNA polymerase III delta subunit